MAEPPPPPPQLAYAAAPAGTTNTLAVVSVISGVLSWVLLPVVGAVVAVITGHLARREIRRTGEQGEGLAMIGLVLGYVHLAVGALLVGLLVLLLVGVFGAIAIGGIHSR